MIGYYGYRHAHKMIWSEQFISDDMKICGCKASFLHTVVLFIYLAQGKHKKAQFLSVLQRIFPHYYLKQVWM